MMEGTQIEYKSLRKVHGLKADLSSLAETCVCFANAQGGMVIIGQEDGDPAPPRDQRIPEGLLNKIITRLRSLTDSVGLADGEVVTHANGGQYISFRVFPSNRTIATTSTGKVFLRIQDQCHPISGEDLTRLAAEKNAFQWELVEVSFARLAEVPKESLASFAKRIRASVRVKDSVKAKDDLEIARHYELCTDQRLTNLGVLWLGTPVWRARIAYPITVQYIVYDKLGAKVRKENWHDHVHDPHALILDIEAQATELRYFYEFPQGLFRKRIQQYAAEVVRELLINAVAHKKYTISGDVFIEVHPDRVEVTNPGCLPLGITPGNILHQRHRRNPHLIRILHDLVMMEGEGSGYDLIYEIDGKDNKPYPVVQTEFDLTRVTQSSVVLDQEVVYLMEYIAKNYQLSQKEFIVLGIVARERKLLATELTRMLQLTEEDRLRSYVGRLVEVGILVTRGQRKGTSYLLNPDLVAASSTNMKPTLRTLELPRLKALVEEDLRQHPRSMIGDLHGRIPDIQRRELKKALDELVKSGVVHHSQGRKYRTYWLA